MGDDDGSCMDKYQDIEGVCGAWQNSGAMSVVKGVAQGLFNVVGLGPAVNSLSGGSDYLNTTEGIVQCWSNHVSSVTAELKDKLDAAKEQLSEDERTLLQTLFRKYQVSTNRTLSLLTGRVNQNSFFIGIVAVAILLVVVYILSLPVPSDNAK
jgi:hypothetical protein